MMGLRLLFAVVVTVLVMQEAWSGTEGSRLRPLPKLDRNLPTGPAVGARIPRFQLPDQSGRQRTYTDLKGPRGLVLLFHRSADW